MTRTLLALLLLAGCAPPDSSGTSVGNPGLFAMQAAPGEDVEIVFGWGHTDRALLHDCVDDEEEVLLEPRAFGDVQDLPSGEWCAIELMMSNPLELELVVPSLSDKHFIVNMPLEALAVSAHHPFAIEAQGEYVLDFGAPGWLRPEHFLLDDDQLWLRPEAEGEIFDVLQMGSAFFVDKDRDGELNEEERGAGALAAGNPDDALEPGWDGDGDGDDDDSGEATDPSCQAGGSLAFLPWLLGPIALRRRPHRP